MTAEGSPLYMQAGVTTRQISAENPTGEKNGGCRAEPDPENPELRHSGAAVKLGKGWKVRPFIPVYKDTTVTLAEIEGPGCINEIFLTSNIACFSDLVVRIYWDGEESPSVECPIGAFFAMGLDNAPHIVASAMVTVAPERGMNCYWQMPFKKSAKITLSNEGYQDADIVAYRILYKLHGIPEDAAYFHAEYRRSQTGREFPEHIILDGVAGRGVYVGTYLAYNVFVSGWWGEGEVKFYLDGDEYPSIVDNGTEDYFGGAWNFGSDGQHIADRAAKRERAFNSPYLGLPLALSDNPAGPRKYGMYRWHVLDSVGFTKGFKATVQTLSWYRQGRFYRPAAIDVSSVAYWYQTEPHVKFPPLPNSEERSDY